MDLYQLRYFLEAGRELNFTRAAENLHVSPSAVSRSVALLERSLGKRLFARTKRHVALSADGETLKARAEAVFDEVERAEAELSGTDRAPVLLRLASREMITNYLLPGPLAQFKARYPETRFVFRSLPPESMAAALRKDQIDLGFYYADLHEPGLESRLLGRLRSHVYASKTYLKMRPGRDALKHPFIAPRSSGESPDGFPDQRHPRKIQYEAEFLATHKAFILQGLCVGVLPDLVVKEERRRGEVTALGGPTIHRSIYGFRRKERALPRAVDFLLSAVSRALKDFP